MGYDAFSGCCRATSITIPYVKIKGKPFLPRICATAPRGCFVLLRRKEGGAGGRAKQPTRDLSMQ